MPGLHAALPRMCQFYCTPRRYMWYVDAGNGHKVLQAEGRNKPTNAWRCMRLCMLRRKAFQLMLQSEQAGLARCDHLGSSESPC